jgi:hypothetical protein
MAVSGRLYAPVALFPVPISQEAGWDSGTISTGTENLTHSWVRTTDQPPNNYDGKVKNGLFLKSS